MKHRGHCCFNCLSEESKAGCGPCTTNNAVGCGWWIQPPSTPVDLVWMWGRRGTHRHVIMGGDGLNLPRRRYFLDSSWSTDPEGVHSALQVLDQLHGHFLSVTLTFDFLVPAPLLHGRPNVVTHVRLHEIERTSKLLHRTHQLIGVCCAAVAVQK